MKKIDTKAKSLILGLLLFICGFIVCITLLFDSNSPTHYIFLPFMPLVFAVCCILFSDILCYVPQNLGVTILLVLLFIRTVLTPFVMFMGSYKSVVYLNVESNTTPAIFLIIWETISVFLAVFLYLKKKGTKTGETKLVEDISNHKSLKKYFIFVLIAFSVLLVCDIIAPEMMSSYRNIFDIGNEHFTSFEDSDIVKKYGTTFLKKFAIVLGRYIARALILLIPACIIVFLSYKKKPIYKLLGFCVCFAPMFFIAGGIARSLIYIVCLLLLYTNCSNVGMPSFKQLLPLGLGGVFVIWWWLFRDDPGSVWSFMSARLNAYFSGVNIVSGGFNLPSALEYRIRYFLNDFTGTIPFGGTIFGISYAPVQSFFNLANGTSGQIPPAISMGNYYLGPIFAPIYSVVFALLAVNSGIQLRNNKNMHPMKYIRLLVSVFQFSMGVVMYNIEITMTAVFSLILPMYIIERLSYKKPSRSNINNDT